MSAQDHLDQFYVELQAWIDGGCAPEYDPFSRYVGLCRNLLNWSSRTNSMSRYDAAADLMEQTFVLAGRCGGGPFDGGVGMYNHRTGSNRYANPARLAWIKEHAEAALARRAAGEVAT